jgi:hypothetical protein
MPDSNLLIVRDRRHDFNHVCELANRLRDFVFQRSEPRDLLSDHHLRGGISVAQRWRREAAS